MTDMLRARRYGSVQLDPAVIVERELGGQLSEHTVLPAVQILRMAAAGCLAVVRPWRQRYPGRLLTQCASMRAARSAHRPAARRADNFEGRPSCVGLTAGWFGRDDKVRLR